MKSCGVVGAGGAGFPSYAKLNKKAETIILNCAECEPLFRVHRQLLAKYTNEILTALETVRDAVGANEIIVAVKPSYKDAIESVTEKLSSFPAVRIATLPEVYPAGDEIVTIYETTGKVVPPGELPISVGCIVYNVETMLNTYYAVTEGRPVTHKYVTVGGAVKSPATFYVPVGMKFSELLKLAGGAVTDDPAYLSGGPMTGNLATLSDVVTKTTNALLVFPETHQLIKKRQAKTTLNIRRSMSSCCQCSTCTDMCPRHMLGYPIEPHAFMRACSKGMETDIKAVVNTLYCSQCGVCEMFACPQDLAPKSLIGVAKNNLRAAGLKVTPQVAKPVNPLRESRYVQMDRLIARLGLTRYAVDAPLMDEKIAPKEIKVLFSQHIGAPAQPLVKKGDTVAADQKIASVGDKLGAEISAPASGKVVEATDKYLVIRTDGKGI